MATSLADEKEEPKIEKFEVVKTIIELPTIPVQNMISSGQVQTSVNGIVVQNGLATNQVFTLLCRSEFVCEFYGEENAKCMDFSVYIKTKFIIVLHSEFIYFMYVYNQRIQMDASLLVENVLNFCRNFYRHK